MRMRQIYTIYFALLQELRVAFDAESVPSGKQHLLLTAAVSSRKEIIDGGYEIAAVVS